MTEHKKSFRTLKNEFIQEWNLTIFNSQKKVTMKTDASNTIIAEILQQEEKSVDFFLSEIISSRTELHYNWKRNAGSHIWDQSIVILFKESQIHNNHTNWL